MKHELIPCTEKTPPCDPRNCPKEFCTWRDTVWAPHLLDSVDKLGTFGKLKSTKKIRRQES